MSSKFLDKTGLDTLWAKIKSTFQTLGNLVTAWGNTPSDTKYPSEKLVKTSLDAKVNFVIGPFLYDVTHIVGLCKTCNGVNTATTENIFGTLSFSRTGGYGDNSYICRFKFAQGSSSTLSVSWSMDTNKEYDGSSISSVLGFRAVKFKYNGVEWAGIAYKSLGATFPLMEYCAYKTEPFFVLYNASSVSDIVFLDSTNSIRQCVISNSYKAKAFDSTFTGTDSIKSALDGKVPGTALSVSVPASSTRYVKMVVPSGYHHYLVFFNASQGVLHAEWLFRSYGDGGTARTTVNYIGALVTARKWYVAGSSGNTFYIEFVNGSTGSQSLNFKVCALDISALPTLTVESEVPSGYVEQPVVGTVASQLLTARNLAVSLSNTSTDTPFDGHAAVTNIKTTGTLDVEHGGTGNTSVDTAPTANSTKMVTSGGIKTALDEKVDKVSGKGLSTNDFTTDEKDKLAGIASGAEVNVQSDWNQTDSTSDDYIKNKPQNLVQDASYVHTDNNYTTAEKTKLSGIAEGAEVNVQSDWNQTDSTSDDYIKNKPTVSRYFNKYSGGTSVYGWKIGSTVTRNIDGVSSIITGVFTLALGIRVENAPQESTAVKTMATMVGFFSCYARYESGANVVKARIYTPVSSIFNATYNIKYIDEGNGKFTWVLGFGTGTTPISKDFVHCSVNVMSSINADFENFGDAITSAPTYPSGAYFTVFKSPVIGQNTSGVGDATKPVYADTNGFIKECTSVNADTVDGFHFSTSTSGSATNTVYLV